MQSAAQGGCVHRPVDEGGPIAGRRSRPPATRTASVGIPNRAAARQRRWNDLAEPGHDGRRHGAAERPGHGPRPLTGLVRAQNQSLRPPVGPTLVLGSGGSHGGVCDMVRRSVATAAPASGGIPPTGGTARAGDAAGIRRPRRPAAAPRSRGACPARRRRAPRSPRGRSIQSRPPSPRAKAAVASASAQVRWGPSTVIEASAVAGRPPGPAVPQVAPPLGRARRGDRAVVEVEGGEDLGQGGPGRRRRSATAARCPAVGRPAVGRPAVHGPAGRRRPRRTSARARPRRARPRRRSVAQPFTKPAGSNGNGGSGRRARKAPPVTCSSQVQASSTSTTSAGPSSGWRSPRLMALMTLSARYVLKMASSRSSSASTASIAASTTSGGASSWTTMLAIVPIVGATRRTPVTCGRSATWISRRPGSPAARRGSRRR